MVVAFALILAGSVLATRPGLRRGGPAADVDDARRVAQVLGIDHHVFNLADEFDRHVVDPYVASHVNGETPNPCVECNRSIKFGALLARASRLGFETVATGHHARVTQSDDGFELRRGHDAGKDQSYVLGFLASATLANVLLPIGTMLKAEVRARAHALGLRTAAKPDSQEVCFIPRGRRSGFLESRTTLTPGTVLDRATKAPLGSVPAIELVTVGQRRGIGHGSDGEPRFVVDVDIPGRVVLVSRRDEIAVVGLDVDHDSVTWARVPLDDGACVLVQTSAHGVAAPATLRIGAGTRFEFEHPVRPVAPGQLAVLYDSGDPELVVGAATVARRVPAHA